MSTLSSKAYEEIHRLIVSGDLPSTEMISEAALAKRLRISRTPVREAVRQLTQEGLLEQIPRYGTVIRKLDRRDLAELYHVREALESHAAAQAAEKLTERQLAQLALLVDAMREIGKAANGAGSRDLAREAVAKFMGVDKAFHMLILEAAGNRRLIKIVRETRALSDLFRLQLRTEPLRLVEQAIDYHQRILVGLQERNGQKAAAAMAEHIRTALNEAMAYFEQLQVYAAGDSESIMNTLPQDLRKKLARV